MNYLVHSHLAKVGWCRPLGGGQFWIQQDTALCCEPAHGTEHHTPRSHRGRDWRLKGKESVVRSSADFSLVPRSWCGGGRQCRPSVF